MPKSIEHKIIKQVYKKQHNAIQAIKNSKLPKKEKDRLTLLANEKYSSFRDIPTPELIELTKPMLNGQSLPHAIQRPGLDKIAFMILIHAAKNGRSLQEVFKDVQERIENIAIDG